MKVTYITTKYLYKCNRNVRMKSNPDKISVFQNHSNANTVSLDEIEDCLQVSKDMSVRDKIDYFSSNSLDYVKVLQYYDYVTRLNNNYKKAPFEKSNIVNFKRSDKEDIFASDSLDYIKLFQKFDNVERLNNIYKKKLTEIVWNNTKNDLLQPELFYNMMVFAFHLLMSK